ncbi:MAG: Lrp/AsnC family transcriptional regulator [Pedosphaera sp.]|nr:Lrp/AsnC family transcriptional regulator [Pedosphaera sp.]
MQLVVPVDTADPLNARILAVSEDRLQGYHRDPMAAIAQLVDLPLTTVIERIQALLVAGTIRRVRQTLLATSLADGALCAWQVPPDSTDAAFDYLFQQDPFSGHVVIRSTDAATPGSQYRLWTTLKVPQGFSLEKHAGYLAGKIGASQYRLMPAKKLFALGVGHVRRRGMEPGARAEAPAEAVDVQVAQLSPLDWRVLTAIKREFLPSELTSNLWQARADEADVPLSVFHEVAEDLDRRKIIGRFSTFLEHVKTLASGERVTKFNALFHWEVPAGREVEAGREVGRHFIMTHAYWREGGPEFRNVNVMGVAHGTDKTTVLAHKAAIDRHLEESEIAIGYTNVFWGGRSEIKPSEISPLAYLAWCRQSGLDPDTLRT